MTFDTWTRRLPCSPSPSSAAARPQRRHYASSGNDPVSEKPLVVKVGRFGPYVTDGETNASLRASDQVETLTLERAVELLAARRESGPTKPVPAERLGVPNKFATSSPGSIPGKNQRYSRGQRTPVAPGMRYREGKPMRGARATGVGGQKRKKPLIPLEFRGQMTYAVRKRFAGNERRGTT